MSVDEKMETSCEDFDSFIEAYEIAWVSGSVPRLSDYLPDSRHPQFQGVLLELARVDVEWRWKTSQPLPLDHYLSEFPALKSEPGAVRQLAFEEFRARRTAGQSVSAIEYADRYGISTSSWGVAHRNAPPVEPPGEWTANQLDLPVEQSPSPIAMDRDGITRLLPGFQLLGELGRGAFSRVFLARQLDLANRQVVLKISAESFAESDKMAQLQHANIVPIYSVHRAGPLFAVCMPYFGATTVADLVGQLGDSRQLPLTAMIIADTVLASASSTQLAGQAAAEPGEHSPAITGVAGCSNSHPAARNKNMAFLKQLQEYSYVEAVLAIGEQLADGLSHAHERGIIHRDLKPANVLIADDGRPMLLDFNLSEDLKPASCESNAIVGGTLPYMAPEQLAAFQERRSARDPRSDLYSLGAILYELLTGRQPFPSRSGELDYVLSAMRADRQQVPAGVRKFNRAASPAVEAIVNHCLAADPQRRYQNAAELAADLQRQLNQQPLKHAREPSLRERATKWTIRHPRLTAVTTIATVVTGMVWGINTYSEQRRLANLRDEVAGLMRSGQEALDHGEADVAQGRFRAAWMKVQSEPALVDHQAGVAGWLDHSRREVIQQQWKQRVPPRRFEERRDEAILLSLLFEPAAPNAFAVARDAIHAARELTVAGDPGWIVERELLLHVEVDLIAAHSNARQALDFLEKSDEFQSRPVLEHRAALLEQLGRPDEAALFREQAHQLPKNEIDETYLSALNRLRRREFDFARQDLETLQDAHPENFATRLLLAICLLQQNRPREARVALSACIAQRPYCPWSYFFRAQSKVATQDLAGASLDFRRVLELSPSEPVRQAVRAQLIVIDKTMASVSRNLTIRPAH